MSAGGRAPRVSGRTGPNDARLAVGLLRLLALLPPPATAQQQLDPSAVAAILDGADHGGNGGGYVVSQHQLLDDLRSSGRGALATDDIVLQDCARPGGEFPRRWVGDGFCDDGTDALDGSPNFNCPGFDCDAGDCGDSCPSAGMRDEAVVLQPDGPPVHVTLSAASSPRHFLFSARSGQAYYIQQRAAGPSPGVAMVSIKDPLTLKTAAVDTTGWLRWQCPADLQGIWVIRVDPAYRNSVAVDLSIATEQDAAISRDVCTGPPVQVVVDALPARTTIAMSSGFLPHPCVFQLSCSDRNARVRAEFPEYRSSIGAATMTITDAGPTGRAERRGLTLAELSGRPAVPGTYVGSFGGSLQLSLSFTSRSAKSIGMNAMFRAVVLAVGETVILLTSRLHPY